MQRLLPKLRISPPTGPLVSGRGFYQLEESSLYVQIGPFAPDRPFFSFLESDRLRFDIDREGHLIFIEVAAGRHTWKVDSNLKLPQHPPPADLHWLDFRSAIAEPSLFTNHRRTTLLARFPHSGTTRPFSLADNVIIEVTGENHLAGLWIDDIVDDLAGQEIARFRSQLRP